RGPVVEHQVDAGDHGDQEQKESDSAHAPAEAQTEGVTLDLGGMKVQPDVAGDDLDAVARPVFIAVAKNRSPGLGLDDLPLGLLPVKLPHRKSLSSVRSRHAGAV